MHFPALDAFSASCNRPVRVIKKAVGASEGQTFFDASDPLGGALVKSGGGRTIAVELTTVDATVAAIQSIGPYLLKLDTHGFERSIIEGASAALSQASVLVIEAYSYRITDEAMLFWELCAFLHERGFRPVDLVDVLHRKYDDSLWQMDLFFIRSDWRNFDVIAYR